MRCACGADEPYAVYDGEWSNGAAQGRGTVYSHWSNGDKYQISGQFENDYAEGVMQIQWEQSGATYHGQFNCVNSVIQPAVSRWYSLYFQAEPNRYFYTYSQETDEWGIPWAGLTMEDGFGVTLVGFAEVN